MLIKGQTCNMQRFKKKKAVIFDLWNTLIVKQGDNLAKLVEYHYAFPVDSIKYWIHQSAKNNKPNDRFYYIRKLFEANGSKFEVKDELVFNEIYATYHSDCSWIEGAETTLIELRKNNIKTALLSNCHNSTIGVINNFNLRNYLNTIVLSYEVGCLKPSPKIFNIAMNKLGVSLHDTLMVGDSYATDVAGARAIGLDVLWFCNSKSKIDDGQAQKINNIKEVLPFVF